ncbi:MAG: bifunctional demethylmenaquinone methyltransferase/2-methoxy-6-polyprenyl-1,4-benzoquinol methylase UbiE [Breznakibacter sp.]
MTVKPYKNDTGNKKDQVARMFNNIAPKYDFLNHFLSMGIDKLWRKRAIKLLKSAKPQKVLDVATGTGDLAIALSKKLGTKVTGLDLSSEMLKVAERKIEKLDNIVIELVQGDSENLPFSSDVFDAITVAFGVRNFEHLEKGLTEMMRVLKPGGRMVILEFSKPSAFPMKQLYNFYFKTILPFCGGLISKDKAAYTYLPESVNQFPEGKAFTSILEGIGMVSIKEYRQTFGIATIYFSEKPIQ